LMKIKFRFFIKLFLFKYDKAIFSVLFDPLLKYNLNL